MQNKQKNFRKIPAAFILLPVIALALWVQGCANHEKTPVNVQTQAATLHRHQHRSFNNMLWIGLSR
jgi:hypothetical protein